MSTQIAVGYQPDPAPPDSDAAKDADNLAFLASLPADERRIWLERCRLLRWVDQLAERDRWGWQAFLRQWRYHQRTGWRDTGPYAAEVHRIERAWFDCAVDDEWDQAARAWDSWLDALSADYGRSTVPRTLEEHDQMVADVGSFFRLFPYLSAEQWEAIGPFGALDQAWNNVRDIAEDAAAGRCYFPEDKLGYFGVTRDEVLAGEAHWFQKWGAFMSFWLDGHMASLAARAHAFVCVTDLHPSVAAMRACCLRRYERVERVLRGVYFDYRAFPEVYAAEVRRELGEAAMGGGVNGVM